MSKFIMLVFCLFIGHSVLHAQNSLKGSWCWKVSKCDNEIGGGRKLNDGYTTIVFRQDFTFTMQTFAADNSVLSTKNGHYSGDDKSLKLFYSDNVTIDKLQLEFQGKDYVTITGSPGLKSMPCTYYAVRYSEK